MSYLIEKRKEKKAKFLTVFAESRCLIATACRIADIPRSTYYLWVNPDSNYYDAEFAEKIEHLKEEGKDSVESKLLDLINIGDTTATIFYCKTKMKDRGYVESIDNISSDGSMSPISEEDREILARFKNNAE